MNDPLALFLASRDPETVAREWTSASLADVRLEGRSVPKDRMVRLGAVVYAWDKRWCSNGHELGDDSVYALRKGRGDVEYRCKQCHSDQQKARRVYRNRQRKA